MNVFEKVRGIIGSIFQIGLGGPQLKNDTGAIEARDASDATFAVVRGATPVANNDLVTKAYVDGIAGGEVPATRVIATTGGLQGGGDLSANRTLSVAPSVPNFSNAASPNLTASPDNKMWLLFGAASTPKLPDAAANLGSFCTVGLLNIAAGVTVGVTTAGDLIDGAATYAITGNWHTATFFAYTPPPGAPGAGVPAWKAFPGGS